MSKKVVLMAQDLNIYPPDLQRIYVEFYDAKSTIMKLEILNPKFETILKFETSHSLPSS